MYRDLVFLWAFITFKGDLTQVLRKNEIKFTLIYSQEFFMGKDFTCIVQKELSS